MEVSVYCAIVCKRAYIGSETSWTRNVTGRIPQVVQTLPVVQRCRVVLEGAKVQGGARGCRGAGWCSRVLGGASIFFFGGASIIFLGGTSIIFFGGC